MTMTQANSNFDKERFLNPRATYRGEFTPANLAFNANLQEFANKVTVICALETNGKISPTDAYKQIKELWKKLQESKRNLLDGA
jgi:sigma54-dependent transcription regulator